MGIIISPRDYDDWRWAGSGVNPPGPAVDAVLTEVQTDEWLWVFSNNSVMVFPDQQIPHDYAEGTDIIPHLHFMATTTATYTGTWTAVFTTWLSAATGSPRQAPLTVTAAFDQSMTAGQCQSLNFSANIPGTDRKISSLMTATLKLSLSAGSELALLGFDGHYLKDRLGSTAPTAK